MAQAICKNDIVRDRMGYHKGTGKVRAVPENPGAYYFVDVVWEDSPTPEISLADWLEKTNA